MMPQSVFMIGWEYPPHNSGGLGVACQGMTQALAQAGDHIYFTLPYDVSTQIDHMQVLGCFNPQWFSDTSPKNQPPFGVYQTSDLTPRQLKKLMNAHQLRALPQSELEQR